MARSLFWSKLWIRTRLAGLFPSVRALTNGDTDYLRYYSDRVLAAPLEGVLDPALFPPSAGPHVVDLNLSAPHFDSALSQNRLSAERGGLPPAWGLAELRSALADWYLQRDGVALDPQDQVLVTHGASAAYSAAMEAFVNPGDRVVLFDPSSPLFALGAQSRRARVTWVPTWNEDGRCRVLPAALQQALRGAKMLVFSDPANPTGACFSLDDYEMIAKLARRFDVLIYRDDAFGRFRYEAKSRAFETVADAERRTITAGSATASFGLGSARVGWLTGPKALVRGCALTANLAAPFVPTACQQLVLRSLAEGEDRSFAAVREQFHGKRQYTFDRLKAMGLEPEWPAAGYFCWVAVGHLGLKGREFAERLYQERQVLVGPGELYSPLGDGHVRVSFAVEDGRLREGLTRLASFVNRMKKPEPVAVEKIPEVPEETLESPGISDARRPVFSRT